MKLNSEIMKLLWIAILCVSFSQIYLSNELFAQDSIRSIPCCFADTISPLCFTEAVSLPVELKVCGQVIDVSSCLNGVISSSSTLKMRVSWASEYYPDSIIYIIFWCCENTNELIGKNIEFSVKGLFANELDRFEPIFNKFNSGSLPFYYLCKNEEDKIHFRRCLNECQYR